MRKLKLLLVAMFACVGAFAQNESFYGFSLESGVPFKLISIDKISMGDGTDTYRDAETKKNLTGKYHFAYDSRHQIYIIAELKNGRLNGSWKSFRKRSLFQDFNYVDGRLEGKQLSFYSDLTNEFYRKAGVPVGTLKQYYGDGRKKSETDYENGEVVAERNYDDKGNLINPPEENGRHIERDDDGYLLREEYQDGTGKSTRKEYYSCGILRSEVSYENSKLSGKSKYYYRTGNIWKTFSMKNIDNEEIDVKEYNYYTGKLSFEYSSVQGKREGGFKKYYEDGILWQEGSYANNKLKLVKEYYHNGKTKSIRQYSDGYLDSEEKYDINGKQI